MHPKTTTATCIRTSLELELHQVHACLGVLHTTYCISTEGGGAGHSTDAPVVGLALDSAAQVHAHKIPQRTLEAWAAHVPVQQRRVDDARVVQLCGSEAGDAVQGTQTLSALRSFSSEWPTRTALDGNSAWEHTHHIYEAAARKPHTCTSRWTSSSLYVTSASMASVMPLNLHLCQTRALLPPWAPNCVL
jgi:hypothetical protein